MRAASPTTLAEAVDLLHRTPDLVPVAGCTDLMVTTPEARASLPGVLNLLSVKELWGIEEGDGHLKIGAATPFWEIHQSPLVQQHCPALAAAARVVGGWQIQNRATLGGNMANASPAGDSLPVLLALNATVVVAGQAGERRLPYDQFHVGYRKTALRPGELIARVELPLAPLPQAGSHQAFRKVGTREAQAISKVVVAAWFQIEDGRYTDLRLAAGSVAATPVRLTAVEEALRGQSATPEIADRAGELAAASVEPIDDVRSTARYRRHVLGRVVRRMLLQQLPDIHA